MNKNKGKWAVCALVSMVLLANCGEKKCKYKPTPIFEQGLPHVKQYNFEVEKQQSQESLLLDTDVLLEIYQNICDESLQEYKFTVKGDFAQMPDSLWVKEASRQLVFLSSFGPRQRALKEWADLLESIRADMRIGQNHEIQAGTFVKIDRIVSPEQGQLLVTFTQQ